MIKLVTADKVQIKQVYKLYKKSFPIAERKPWFIIKKSDEVKILAILNNDKFVGMMIIIEYKDIVYVEYFSIIENKRGKGIGGEALRELSFLYKEKRIALEIENIEELKATNIEERKKRKIFYFKNGFKSNELNLLLVFGQKMEVLFLTEPIEFKEYQELFKKAYGNLFYKFMRVRIDKNNK